MLSFLHLIPVIQHTTFLLPCKIFLFKSHLVSPVVVLWNWLPRHISQNLGWSEDYQLQVVNCLLSPENYNVLHHFTPGFGSLSLQTLISFGVLVDLASQWCFSCFILKPRGRKLCLIYITLYLSDSSLYNWGGWKACCLKLLLCLTIKVSIISRPEHFFVCPWSIATSYVSQLRKQLFSIFLNMPVMVTGC